MTMLADPRPLVTVGVDTHLDFHVAGALDDRGRCLGSMELPATPGGYRALSRWAEELGTPVAFAVEGTGSWGAGLAATLVAQGYDVREITRPDRRARRNQGKSDTLDAFAAARLAQAGEARAKAKTRDGQVESIRVLRVARSSAITGRTNALQQLRSLIVSAPVELRARLEACSPPILVRTCASFRVWDPSTPEGATKMALRWLARRYRSFDVEIGELDDALEPLVRSQAPKLIERFGVGIEVAGALLVALGDNPDRIRSEAAFAKLCGVAPLLASSGKTRRHRLSRGGNRQANRALHVVVLTRMRWDQPTRDYVERRTAEGLSKREIIRCLKRYVAREVYEILVPRVRVEEVPIAA